MGLKFGNLSKLTGITYFRLSPHEQNPFAGMVKDGIGSFGRTSGRFLTRGFPILLLTYVTMVWANEANRKASRKPQPK